MVIGLLGILKAGGAYVPLDPAYPKARLAFMLEDAQVSVLLTQSSLTKELPKTSAQVVVLDVETEALSRYHSENTKSHLGPENLAYVIYTSGSTGTPKGVMISHQSVVNFLNAMRLAPGLTDQDILLAVTTLSFDIATLELYLPLIIGAQLVLVNREIASDGIQLSNRLKVTGTTVMQATPATWRMLLEAGWEGHFLRKILIGGEALPHELAHQLVDTGALVWNMYGPTETTVWSTCYQITVSVDAIRDIMVSIGRPIANTQVYLLNRYQELVPIGIPGELHIGGAGLARGYLNRPELTAEKFIQNPFSDDPESRLYKTGDLARYLPDGNIEYLGRIDNQVKIRGFRIELGEIEAVLGQHSLVRENAVIVHVTEKMDQRLVAYIVSSEEQIIENADLRVFLTERLPDYMIPSAFVTVDALPLTPNGKIDRRTLSQRSIENYQLPEESFVAPRDSLELQLAQIWEDILNVHPIGVHDNFFELGGHSLLAVSLMAQIGQQLNKNLPLATLFQGATIEQLAVILRQQTDILSWSPLVTVQPNGSKQPFFCIPGGGGNVLYLYELARHLGTDQPFYGLQSVGLDGQSKPYTRVEDMAARYIKEIQTVQPEGPYFLGGHSFGGPVAFEMSQQLQKQGHEVALLAILDTTAPLSRSKVQPVVQDDTQVLVDIATVIEQWSGKPLEISYGILQPLDFDEQFNYLYDRLKATGVVAQENKAFLRGYVAVHKAIAEVHYVPSSDVIPTHIVLFKAEIESISESTDEEMLGVLSEPSWGWKQFSKDTVEVHVVPGDHHTMVNPPHVQVLAEQLKVYLEQAMTNDR
jgi:amino acid adenylation domain-containing protein